MKNIEEQFIHQQNSQGVEVSGDKIETTKDAPSAEIQITTEDKYGPEAIKEDIRFKAEKIRNWSREKGFIEGKDFLIVESVTDVEKDIKSIAPHEFKQFFVVILQEKYYGSFKDYILGRYSEERRLENPKNKYGGPRLDFSWGGRFAVGWDGVPFDTVAASSIEKISAPTHHEEFRNFFKQKTGFDFPTSEMLNPILKEMSEKGIEIYELALDKLKKMKDQNTLPDDGYGLIDATEHALMILKDAKNGEALIDLPEVLTGTMPAEMRHYADLTYNIEDIKDFGRVSEITGVVIPNELRIDKIFDRYNFDRKEMENVCRDFSDYIVAKNELGN